MNNDEISILIRKLIYIKNKYKKNETILNMINHHINILYSLKKYTPNEIYDMKYNNSFYLIIDNIKKFINKL